tara:strand:+ start:188 stop:979 length:792 start_codon:yes stop_codon:yes gene_type:complete
MQNNNLAQLELSSVIGQSFELPDDLYIPPNALEICLEKFSGPLDLLLYLIKKENINILELDISKITDQYLDYIELMDVLKFELAADYLVMAATLAEIKSRLMLPKENFEDEEEDPRTNLIKRLQQYQRFKHVSEKIALLPRIDRDFYLASAEFPNLNKNNRFDFEISKNDLYESFLEILNRPDYKLNHLVEFEELSTKERIQYLLEILSKKNLIRFSKTLKESEGRQGVVVSLLASLELAKDGYIELIQNKSEEIFIKKIRIT